MKVYLYGDINVKEFWSECDAGILPSNLLYGATRLSQFGIDVIKHPSGYIRKRWKLTLNTFFRVFFCKEKYDVFYAIHPRGIELIVLLRALGLYRHPVVVWHHQPVKKARNWLRELFARFYYKGYDELLMFSERIVEVSAKSCKADPKKMHVVHWGADMDYYVRKRKPLSGREGMISTGKEERDVISLIDAFVSTDIPLSIYLSERNGKRNYRAELETVVIPDNIHLHMPANLTRDEMSEEVSKSRCVVICCHKTDYTVGLTTLVEAFALGVPVISSRNEAFPMDIEKEGVGLYVDYYDVEGWKNAARFFYDNPQMVFDMGEKGFRLAQSQYNDAICAREVAEILIAASKSK